MGDDVVQFFFWNGETGFKRNGDTSSFRLAGQNVDTELFEDTVQKPWVPLR
jgi:hypothetical protein